MRKCWSFLLAFLLLSGIWTQMAQAERGRHSGGKPYEPGFGRGLGRLARKDLNLSKDQSKKLDSLELDFKKGMVDLSSGIRTKQLELRELWSADTPDESKINAKIDEIGKLRTEIQKKRTSHLLEVKKNLTEEQWLKLKSTPGFCGEKFGGPGPTRKRR